MLIIRAAPYYITYVINGLSSPQCTRLPGSLQFHGWVSYLPSLQTAVVLAGLSGEGHRQDSLSVRLKSPSRRRRNCWKGGAEHGLEHLRAPHIPLRIHSIRWRRRSSSSRSGRAGTRDPSHETSSSGTAESLARCCGQCMLAHCRNQALSSPGAVLVLGLILLVILHGSSVQRDVAEEWECSLPPSWICYTLPCVLQTGVLHLQRARHYPWDSACMSTERVHSDCLDMGWIWWSKRHGVGF